MGVTQLALTRIRNEVDAAREEAVQRYYQEHYFLLKLGDSIKGDFGAIDHRSSITLARLAKEALTAEHTLNAAKLRACQQELLVLRNEYQKSAVFKRNAEEQLTEIEHLLRTKALAVPQYSFPTIAPDQPQSIEPFVACPTCGRPFPDPESEGEEIDSQSSSRLEGDWVSESDSMSH